MKVFSYLAILNYLDWCISLR